MIPKIMRQLAMSVGLLFLSLSRVADAAAIIVPDPALDETLAPASTDRMAVLAGGCFWGVEEAVFEHVKGVKTVWSGYAGGAASTAAYDMVRTGRTGHAESVQIIYDASQITYGQLLKLFFAVAHNPTELNRQGPDEGTQYRSAVFSVDSSQSKIAQAYINQLNQAKVFKHKIVTTVTPLQAFYRAEAYHQDYAEHHPADPYIVYNDLPKVQNLRKQFPNFYFGKK